MNDSGMKDGAGRGGWRVGHGYDLHRLEGRPPAGAGRPLVLGGVLLESSRGPIAHSDGDALAHAVVDAILAAIGSEDIGQLFPDTDPSQASRDSMEFLKAAGERMRDAGFELVNVDATVILERPKVSPHKLAMRERMARALGVEVAQVTVKGKTHERVDAVGEGRAVEVHAVALVRAR